MPACWQLHSFIANISTRWRRELSIMDSQRVQAAFAKNLWAPPFTWWHHFQPDPSRRKVSIKSNCLIYQCRKCCEIVYFHSCTLPYFLHHLLMFHKCNFFHFLFTSWRSCILKFEFRFSNYFCVECDARENRVINSTRNKNLCWNFRTIWGGKEPSRNRVVVPASGWRNRFIRINTWAP